VRRSSVLMLVSAVLVLSAPVVAAPPAAAHYTETNYNEFIFLAAPEIVFGDFNGDALVDVATCDSAATKVMVNRGDGVFDAPVTVGDGASWLEAADLNEDGLTDLVGVPTSGVQVCVMLNDGGGTFDAASLSEVGTRPADTVVCDFDGDGHMDIATLGDGVCVLFGRGDGTFEPYVHFTGGSVSGRRYGALNAGDVNGDGLPDIVTYAQVLINDGDRTFSAGQTFADGGLPSALADLNADGKLDFAYGLVVQVYVRDYFHVRLGLGDGSFGTTTLTDYANGTYGYEHAGDIVAGDFDGDGYQDLMLPIDQTYAARMLQMGYTCRILKGDGTGAFSYTRTWAGVYTPAQPTGPVATADLNADGQLDFAVYCAQGGVTGSEGGVVAVCLRRAASALVGTASVYGDAAWATSGQVTVASNVPGATQMRYQSTGSMVLASMHKTQTGSWSDWQPYLPARSCSLPGGGANSGLCIQYRDAGGQTLLLDGSVAVDSTPPVTTVAGAGSRWLNGPVSLTISATDTGGSGVALTEYKLDGASAWAPYLSPIPIAAEGDHTLVCRSRDNVGNVESNQTLAVGIDTSAPSAVSGLASSTHPSQSDWYTDATPALSWNAAADAVSSVAGYSYVLDQVADTVPDATSEGAARSKTYTVARADGVWYFHVRAIDAAGNAGAASHYTVRIDTGAPGDVSGLTSSTHPSQTTWYTSNTPAFGWSAAGDATSAVAGYSYVLDQVADTTPDATSDTSVTSATFGAHADGLWYFHVRAVDAAGNAGAAGHYAVRIDASGLGGIGDVSSSTHPVQTTWYANNTPAFSWSSSP
jgi:hypothetical protein